MTHMRIYRVVAARPEIFIRWTPNEQEARRARQKMREVDPHASIEVVDFELTGEGVLGLLNTIGGSWGIVSSQYRPIIKPLKALGK